MIEKSLAVSHLFVGSLILGSSETTGSASGDETDLSTGGSVPSNGRRHTDVLMVTTTVRMLDRVHSNTTNLGPRVPLSLVLEVSSTGFQQRLIDTTTTGDDSDHSAIGGRNGFLRARRQFDFGFVLVRVMGNDGGVVAGSSGEFATISQLLLQLAHDGSLGHGTNGHHVADGQTGFLTAVHKLSGVHALDRDERLLALLESVGIPEFDNGQRRSSAGVVNDVLHNSLDVSVTLGIVGRPQSSGAFAVLVVRGEDGTRSLTLRTNDIFKRNITKIEFYFKQIETTQL